MNRPFDIIGDFEGGYAFCIEMLPGDAEQAQEIVRMTFPKAFAGYYERKACLCVKTDEAQEAFMLRKMLRNFVQAKKMSNPVYTEDLMRVRKEYED